MKNTHDVRDRADFLHARNRGLALVLLCSAWGCATVDPRLDYARTEEIASARGVGGELYDPGVEAEIAARVDLLLADGLTLEEAIQIALLNNPALRAKFQEVGVARGDLVQSGLLTNPVLTLSAKLPEGGGRADVMAGIGQEIADLWQIPLRKKIAQAELDRVILETARMALGLAADVEAQVYRTVALAEIAGLLERVAASQRRRVDINRERVAVGEAGVAEINEAQLGVYQLEFQLAGVQREWQLSRLALVRMLGLSQKGLEGGIEAELPDPLDPGFDAGALLQEALAERLEIRAAAEAVTAAKAEVERQRRRVFPSVVVGIDSERPERRSMPGRDVAADTLRASAAEGAPTAPDLELPSERDQARRQEIDFMIGPSLAMPLPIWDQNQAQLAISCFRLQLRWKEMDDLADRVAYEVRTALAVLENTRRQALLYRDQILPLAHSDIGLAHARLQAGLQGIALVLEADQAALVLERDYIATRRDYAIALTDLDRAVGRRLRIQPAPESTKTEPATPED